MRFDRVKEDSPVEGVTTSVTVVSAHRHYQLRARRVKDTYSPAGAELVVVRELDSLADVVVDAEEGGRVVGSVVVVVGGLVVVVVVVGTVVGSVVVVTGGLLRARGVWVSTGLSLAN